MATRDDGNQIGVQPAGIREKYKQASLGSNYACLHLREHPNFSDTYVQYRMAVGIMAPSDEFLTPTQENIKNWVWVVAIRIDKDSPVELIATTASFGTNMDDWEFGGLPRRVSMEELKDNGVLLGRFEEASWDDLTWYFSYCEDNNETWPGTDVSFPSAAAGGPNGRRGGYQDGKAVAIQI